MAVRIMAEVFARYPGEGGELLTALKVGDHAHEDGTNVRPSVATLAKSTRQSERTVQRHLRHMVEIGWLIPVESGGGARFWRDGMPVGKPNEYRINPRWIEGDDLSPSQGVTVTSETNDGDTAMSPEPSLEPSCSTPVVPNEEEQAPSAKSIAAAKVLERAIGRSKPMLSMEDWTQLCRAQGMKRMPGDDPVWKIAAQSGIPDEFVRLNWREFVARSIESGKKQRDWRQTFRNSVRDNWYRLWWMPRDATCAQLTSQGLQAEARWDAADAEQAAGTQHAE